jgi:hypothetical protein
MYSEIAEHLKDGRVKVRSGDWPAFLYDENMAYNPKAKDEGLLQGYLLVRVSCSFTSILMA